MPTLAINLFGSIQVSVNAQPVTTFKSDKVRALLAYLAVEADHPHRREKLAGLLWPEMPETTARGSLRHALANLRRVIHDHKTVPPYLLITCQTIQFNANSNHALDVVAFSQSLITTHLTHDQKFQHLEKSMALYRDDFLAGFSVADSIPFEEWMLIKREQYRRQMGDDLSWLANAYEQRGMYKKAIRLAYKQIELNPLDETAHRQLIRLLALDGQRSAALAQYENCRQILAAELVVAPTKTTKILYERIRDETWPDETAKIPLPLFVTEETAVSPPPRFVGRSQELRQLNNFLAQARTGRSQIAFVTGEAGSGKTALVNAFARQVMANHPDLLVASGRCSAYTGSGDPYLPFLQMMQMLTGDVAANWEAGDISSDHARRLWSVLPEVTEALVGNGNLLLDRFVSSASLLTRAQIRTRSRLPDDAPWLVQLAEYAQAGEMMAAFSQTDLFEQFTGLLETLARRHPLLLLLDDLQWIDSGSLNLLFHLGQHLRSRRILILGAYRLGDVARGRDGERHPLADVINELQQIFGYNQVDLSQAGGRPFIDALLDSEPNRLDGNFRQVLLRQTGGQALLTTEFLQGLQERGDLSQRHRLVNAQSRQRLGKQHISRYRFHHFLIQNYLYNELDAVERANLHEAVGDTLEKLYADQDAALAAMLGQLAWHYQEAGALEKAIVYCQKAGERAYLLSQQVGQTPQLIIILSALGSYYLTSGQYHTGLKLSQQKLELAQRFQDDLQIALARLGLAANYTLLGEFVQSCGQIDKLLDFYDFRQHSALANDHTVDPGVNGLIWAALVLWMQGYPDQAERRSQEAIDLARVLEHPLTLTAALEVAAGIMHILSRSYQAARAELTESLQLANAQKFGLFQVEGAFYEGFLLVTEGRTAEGIAQMKASLAGWRATGMRIMYSQMLGLLAEALGQAGQIEAGLQMLDNAFAEVHARDERFFAAELYRIKGDLLRQFERGTPVSSTAVIETAYQQAIAIARRQGAISWELRATISVAKLWQDQGEISRGRLALSKIFGWFTEGFDTPDLQEALALLVELKREKIYG